MEEKKELSIVERINQEINTELSTASVVSALLATTFKGLDPLRMKQALLEGMIRGYTFKDFLSKRVYAIPFGNGYALVTSIEITRAKAMHSGLCGKKAPVYVMDEAQKIVSCSITVSRRVDNFVGEYTAEVFFGEYYKAGKPGYPSFWDTKPRTMIAKVAEMHALRMAFPEEAAKDYIEEEMDDKNHGETRLHEVKDLLVVNDLQMGNFSQKNENSKNKEVEATSEVNESADTDFKPENAIIR